VVVEILVAQRQSVDALRQHLPKLVFHLLLMASVAETTRQPPQQVDPPVGLPQQQRPPSVDT
jgi:hypothetical protein